jgi:hypothetical protein
MHWLNFVLAPAVAGAIALGKDEVRGILQEKAP